MESNYEREREESLQEEVGTNGFLNEETETEEELRERFKETRRFIIIICAIYFILRTSFVIFDTIDVVKMGIPISLCLMSFIGVGISLLLIYFIYKGARFPLYLLIGSCVFAILPNLTLESDGSVITPNRMIDSASKYAALSIGINLIIIVCMMLILKSENCKNYSLMRSMIEANEMKTSKFYHNKKKYIVMFILFVYGITFYIILNDLYGPVVLHKEGNHYTIPSGDTYVDEDGAFSIQYPKGWNVINDPEVADVYFKSTDEPVRVAVHKKSRMNLSKLTEGIYQFYVSANEVYRLSHIELGDMKVVKAILITRNYTMDLEYQYLFNAGNYAYLISLSASDPSLYEELAEDMVKTFEVLERKTKWWLWPSNIANDYKFYAIWTLSNAN